jgi:hypothetical protein
MGPDFSGPLKKVGLSAAAILVELIQRPSAATEQSAYAGTLSTVRNRTDAGSNCGRSGDRQYHIPR